MLITTKLPFILLTLLFLAPSGFAMKRQFDDKTHENKKTPENDGTKIIQAIQRMRITDLSKDVLVYSFDNLTGQELTTAARVCKHWYNLVYNDDGLKSGIGLSRIFGRYAEYLKKPGTWSEFADNYNFASEARNKLLAGANNYDSPQSAQEKMLTNLGKGRSNHKHFLCHGLCYSSSNN